MKLSFSAEVQSAGLTKIQEELSQEIINSCYEENIDFDETQFLKLTIGTNKGYFLYHMHPDDNVIFEAYQPDVIYSVVNSNYSYSYTCPKDMIKKYKENFKKLR